MIHVSPSATVQQQFADTVSTQTRVGAALETDMRNRSRKEPTYPENWRRCRDCRAIIPLKADHDCQSVPSTGEGKEPEPDEERDD